MSFRQYGGLQFSSKNNYNNLINVTSTNDLPKTIGVPNTTIDVLSYLNIIGGINIDFPTVFDNLTVNGLATINTANITNTLNLYNGTHESVVAVNSVGNLTFNNVTNGGSIFFNIKDATSGLITNTVSLTTGNGLASGCSRTPASSANINCFTATSATTTAVMYIGLSPTGGSYNGNVLQNDCFIVGTNGINNGALTLTTSVSSSYPAPSVGSLRLTATNTKVTGTSIDINATATGGLKTTTPQPAFTDVSTSIPTTAWVKGAIDYYGGGGGGNITYTFTTGGTNQSVTVPTGAKFVKIICIGAGGGGGGGWNGISEATGGGGGGGGGISISNVALLNESSFTIMVGAGGNGGTTNFVGTQVSDGIPGGDSYVYINVNNSPFYYTYAYGGTGGKASVQSRTVQPLGGIGGSGNQGVGGNGGNGAGINSANPTGNAYIGGSANGFLLSSLTGNTSTLSGAGGGGGGGAIGSPGYTTYGGNGGGIGNVGYNSIQGNGVGGINAPNDTNYVGATSPTIGPNGIGGGGGGGGYGIYSSNNGFLGPTSGIYGGGGGGAGSSSSNVSLSRCVGGSGGSGVVILEFTS